MSKEPKRTNGNWPRWVLIGAFAFATGCSGTKLTPEETSAIETAKAAIAEHPDLRAYAEFDKPMLDPETGHWTVTVWLNKKTLPGTLSVDIDPDGRVISLTPAY